jgi:hypothetical protein
MQIKILVSLFVLISACSSIFGQGTIDLTRKKVLATRGTILWLPATEQVSIDAKAGKTENRKFKQDESILRIHFKVLSAPPQSAWVLRILDMDGVVKWKYSIENNRDSFWSDEIRNKNVRIQVFSTQEDEPIQILVDGVAFVRGEFYPQAIVGDYDMELFNIQTSPEIKKVGKATALLDFPSDEDGKFQACTAFLISTDLILTNYHCPKTKNEWENTFVYFDYDTENNKHNPTYIKEFIISDKNLDFAIFRLASKLTNREPLLLDSTEPSNGQVLFIIQHPNGKLKKISQLKCIVSQASMQGVSSIFSDFGHSCDTQGGSSGSGVVDPKTNKVIGLHHLGFRPTIFNPDATENRAVKMGLIIAFIKENCAKEKENCHKIIEEIGF